MKYLDRSALATVLGLVRLVLGATVTNDSSVAAGKTFDYIVAGAGLSGLTVGTKLSAQGYSVLIIEAGPDGSWNPAVHNAEGKPFPATFCNWRYPAYGDDGQRLSYSIDAGACIGGSTSINAMVWFRPTEVEVNQLEKLGNPGWNWNTLKPYMEATERNIPPNADQVAQGAGVDPSLHGQNGFINTSFPTPMRIPGAVARYKQTFAKTFPRLVIRNDTSHRLSAASSAATTLYTIWHDPVTGKNRRSSAADGLLWHQQQPTLTLLATHKVDKVLFAADQATTATGVAFLPTNGTSATRLKAYASRGVILAAGTLASAPILERSGVGREDVLRSVGVATVVDLPGVGANLNDQPDVTTFASLLPAYHNDTSIVDNRDLFALVLALVSIKELWGNVSTRYTQGLTSKSRLRSRAQALVAAKAAVNIPGAEAILNATIDLIVNHKLPIAEFLADSVGTTLFTVFWPLLPLSRGHVHISSADPLVYPIITPRLLRDEFDAAVAVAISKASRTVYTTAPIRDIVENPFLVPSIGPAGTDEEYLKWYKDTMFGASHWIGATAMLPRRLGGVVDHKLRVYGTKKLFVVDAGILPFQLTSHMMSMMYAVAGRAADIILAET